mgnify:FL=1|tara:strand:- start:285 stop:476 length:192 start_codon:yes stop_codon:yes gene_type:complete
MKIKRFSDEDLMKFADGELKGGKAMDILSAILEDTPEATNLAKRLAVFTSTRNALVNLVLDSK